MQPGVLRRRGKKRGPAKSKTRIIECKRKERERGLSAVSKSSLTVLNKKEGGRTMFGE